MLAFRFERAMRIPASPAAVLLTLSLIGLLPACTLRLDPKDAAASQAVFDHARARDIAGIEARLAPHLKTAVTDTRLQAQAALIPDRPAQVVKLVDFQTGESGGARATSVTREYVYPDRVLVVVTTIAAAPGQPAQIAQFDVHAFSRAALAVGRFSLAGKSSMQYFLLGLAVAIPLLLVVALAALAREKTARWKWAWTLFILFGLMRVSVNWATGAILFEPFTVIPLGAAVARGPLDISPWIVSVSLPLGALIYLGRLWFAAPADEGD
jgi:hypothetical protein